jgi:hypothetical protein
MRRVSRRMASMEALSAQVSPPLVRIASFIPVHPPEFKL